MGVFIVLIVIVAIAYYRSKEDKKRQQEEQKKLNAGILRAESSDFYKQISRFVQDTISKYEQAIRGEIRSEYINYLGTNSSNPFDINKCSVELRSIRVSGGGIKQVYYDEDEATPSFIYSTQGYADLTNEQFYILVKTIQKNFKCLKLNMATDFELKTAIEKQKNDRYTSCEIKFYLADDYIKLIEKSEVKYLESQKSPYRNAF